MPPTDPDALKHPAGGAVMRRLARGLSDPRALLRLGVAGYLVGFFLFPGGFWQTLWIGILIALPLLHLLSRPTGSRWRRAIAGDPIFRLLAVLLGWVLLASLVNRSVAYGGRDVFGSLVEAGGVLCLCGAIVVAVRTSATPGARLLRPMALGGAAAMGASLVGFYAVAGNAFPTTRLQCVFVYPHLGGLHPVVTGLISGVAAMGAALLCSRSRRVRDRALHLACFGVLVAGCLMTHSRGTMLALGAGFLAFSLTRGDRSWIAPGAVLTLIAAAYLSLPQGQAESLVTRADAGRLGVYRHLLDQMAELPDLVFGQGLWIHPIADEQVVGWNPNHPHSAPLSLFFHGGVPALLLGGAIFTIGLRRAIGVFRASGDATWLILLVFGCTAQIVDGGLPFALAPAPRIEPLLLLFPVVGASAAYQCGAQARFPRNRGVPG